MGKVSSG